MLIHRLHPAIERADPTGKWIPLSAPSPVPSSWVRLGLNMLKRMVEWVVRTVNSNLGASRRVRDKLWDQTSQGHKGYSEPNRCSREEVYADV